MGGLWSGIRAKKKRLVEQCYALDTSDLKRLRLLVQGNGEQAGTLRWMSGAGTKQKQESAVEYTIAVAGTTGTLRLQYTVVATGQEFSTAVGLVATGCHFGGVRWWFTCPLGEGGKLCGRRVRKLYFRESYFGCRRCHELAYRSSQESDSRIYAALRDGLDFEGFSGISNLSISQLRFGLKVLRFEQKWFGRPSKLRRRSNSVDSSHEHVTFPDDASSSSLGGTSGAGATT